MKVRKEQKLKQMIEKSGIGTCDLLLLGALKHVQSRHMTCSTTSRLLTFKAPLLERGHHEILIACSPAKH